VQVGAGVLVVEEPDTGPVTTVLELEGVGLVAPVDVVEVLKDVGPDELLLGLVLPELETVAEGVPDDEVTPEVPLEVVPVEELVPVEEPDVGEDVLEGEVIELVLDPVALEDVEVMEEVVGATVTVERTILMSGRSAMSNFVKRKDGIFASKRVNEYK
jgi:hypothetical protein